MLIRLRNWHDGSIVPYNPAALEVLMMRPNFCFRKWGQAAFVQENAPFRWTSIIWSHSLSDMFLNLNGGLGQSRLKLYGINSLPLIPQNASIVDKDGYWSEGIQRALNDGSAVSDRWGIDDCLATSYSTTSIWEACSARDLRTFHNLINNFLSGRPIEVVNYNVRSARCKE